MCTRIWVVTSKIIRSRARWSGTLWDKEDVLVAQEAVLAELLKGGKEASIRWAVVAGKDGRMKLLMQSLPASAEALSGQASLQRVSMNFSFDYDTS